MKYIFKKVFAILVALTLFSACSPKSSEIIKNSGENKIKVYTSFYPMYDFTKKIGGDKIELYNIIPSSQEAHDWEPTPQDIMNLEAADLFIYNGLGMEHWVDGVISTIKNDKLVILETGINPNIKLLNSEDHEDDYGEYDPHIWLSINNAKEQMKSIKDQLCIVDSVNKDYYENNYEKYGQEFDKLYKEFYNTLTSLSNKTIVVSHEAFAYLANDYGLIQKSVQGLSTEAEPEPAKMAEIIEFAKENQVKVIFFEQQVSPKVSNIIAKEIGAKTDMLSTIESLNDEQLANNEDYLSMMRKNLVALKNALE